MYYTYVLKSEKDGKLYVGWTDNLKERFEKHERGLVQATKNRRPLKLIYYEACLIKEDAIGREKDLKTGFGRAYIKRRLRELNKIPGSSNGRTAGSGPVYLGSNPSPGD